MTVAVLAQPPGPHRPAHAAMVMERLLPDWYFTQPHPPTGVELVVVGRDGVDTLWRMSEGLAGAVAGHLRRWGSQARIVAARSFDDRPRRRGSKR